MGNKRLVERAFYSTLRAIAWAVALPLLAYPMFAILTFWPLLGFILGLERLVGLILEAGFVPSLATALVYEFVLRERKLSIAVFASWAVALVFAYAWYQYLGTDGLGWNYVTYALAAATVCSVGVMPIIDQRARAKWALYQDEKEDRRGRYASVD